jgi:hypothetical protein
MLGIVISLTASVFFIGAIAYLRWFFYRIAPDPWQWLYSQGTRTTLAEPHLSRYRRLLALALGACCSAFLFAGTLHARLSPPERPVVPDALLGYTHYLTTKHGGVYGIYFEYLTLTYGIWSIGGGMPIAVFIAIGLKINLYEGAPAFPLLVFIGAVTSMLLCFAL